MTYTRIKEIGRGGFARVFEVKNDAGKMFALKVFEPNADI
jgi:serine/threonine protein kinase